MASPRVRASRYRRNFLLAQPAVKTRMSERRTSMIGALMATLGPISMSVYTPAMPELVRAFGTSDATIKLTLSIYFAGFSVAQLLAGPASDAFGRRRIDVFNRNIYKTGLLGRFIGAGHLVARLYGVRLSEMIETRSLREQRHFFETRVAPLFDKPAIRWLTSRKSSLFGLGIPPQQFDELASLSDGKSLAPVLKARLEKLSCHFPLRDNYFAWQAYARRYPTGAEGALPTYLKLEHYDAIRANAERVEVHHAGFTELLAQKPAESVDRFVLLDAQDWMTDDQLNALWTEITRTASAGARVIFRTAAEPSLLPGRLSNSLLDQWSYEDEASREFSARDRSAIYGGFHLYVKRSA